MVLWWSCPAITDSSPLTVRARGHSKIKLSFIEFNESLIAYLIIQFDSYTIVKIAL